MTSSKIPALKAIRGVVAKDFGHMENPTIQDTLRKMSDVIDVTEMLSGITRKPTETASVYLERVQANTGKVSGRIARFSEGTRAALTSRRTLVAKDADVAAGLVAGGPFDAEIRSSFKAMESSERFKYLNLLKEKGDGAQLAVILDAPVILTGLPEKFRDEFRAGFVAEKSPDMIAEIEAIDSLLNVSETVGTTAQAFSDKMASSAKLEADNPKEQAQRTQDAADARKAVDAQGALDRVMHG